MTDKSDKKELMELTYDHQPYDIINEVNHALFVNDVGFQFVFLEEDQDDDIPSIFYDLEWTDRLVQE